MNQRQKVHKFCIWYGFDFWARELWKEDIECRKSKRSKRAEIRDREAADMDIDDEEEGMTDSDSDR